ncbi:TonB-dependent receptor domain-containing protein [Flocculibacter collagenilyticus]|uniref:TonB-dependent receptor domain-containing protein n=1 Tax=Flocculibacter collagenilyticus TaxID=2744479 RepID=UPI0018F64BA3|nr:TonB-dependent receptor [Flocculibacter collagenilyticus]
MNYKSTKKTRLTPSSLFSFSSLALAVSSTLFASNVAAEAVPQAVNNMETITVTASRTPKPLSNALTSQVVITREDIALLQPESITDVLSSVPGVDISSQGGRGQNQSIFLRGTNANHTLVVLDGVRISSATLGLANLQGISPETIERIEIVKGPRAALWGSDAIGGVIQIFTRKANEHEVNIGATAGTDNYQAYNANLGVAHGDGKTSFTVARESSDGFDVTKGQEPDDDGYKFTSVSVNGAQNINKALSVNWLANAYTGENEYDNSWGENETEIDNHAWRLGAQYNWLTDNVLSFSIGQSRDSGENFGNGTLKGQGSVFESRRNEVSVLNYSQLSDEWQLNVGADYYQEKISSGVSYIKTERDVSAVFAQSSYQLNSFILEMAVRYDDIEFVDSETTYNASFGYEITDNALISLNLGSAFKAPTFNDLFWPVEAGSTDFLALKPESSDTVELLMKTDVNDVQLDFSIYHYDVENLIQWQPDAGGTWRPQNVNQVEILGLEISAQFEGLGGLHHLNMSYIDTEDKSTGKQLIRRAKELVNYSFTKQFDEVNLIAEYQFRGDRDDATFMGPEELDSYHLVNLAADYRINQQWQLKSKVSNLFDEDYETAFGYNTQDRQIYVGIAYSM